MSLQSEPEPPPPPFPVGARLLYVGDRVVRSQRRRARRKASIAGPFVHLLWIFSIRPVTIVTIAIGVAISVAVYTVVYWRSVRVLEQGRLPEARRVKP